MAQIETESSVTDRVIGILGGMGPEATLDLYRDIIRLTPAKKDQDHIRVLIYSNPKIPDRTKGIERSGESPVPSLIESAQVLERGGARIIAMPCNAAHHYLAEIQQQVSIPIIDMVEESLRWIHAHFPGWKTLGLIASNGTVVSGVYARALGRSGISVLLPSETDQQRTQTAIDQVKLGVHDLTTRQTFESVGLRMVEAGAESIILGCTEVPLAFNLDSVGYPTVNPTRILAKAAVDWALGKR